MKRIVCVLLFLSLAGSVEARTFGLYPDNQLYFLEEWAYGFKQATSFGSDAKAATALSEARDSIEDLAYLQARNRDVAKAEHRLSYALGRANNNIQDIDSLNTQAERVGEMEAVRERITAGNLSGNNTRLQERVSESVQVREQVMERNQSRNKLLEEVAGLKQEYRNRYHNRAYAGIPSDFNEVVEFQLVDDETVLDKLRVEVKDQTINFDTGREATLTVQLRESLYRQIQSEGVDGWQGLMNAYQRNELDIQPLLHAAELGAKYRNQINTQTNTQNQQGR